MPDTAASFKAQMIMDDPPPFFLLGVKKTPTIMYNGFMQNDVVNLKFKVTVIMTYFVENVLENKDNVLWFASLHCFCNTLPGFLNKLPSPGV